MPFRKYPSSSGYVICPSTGGRNPIFSFTRKTSNSGSHSSSQLGYVIEHQGRSQQALEPRSDVPACLTFRVSAHTDARRRRRRFRRRIVLVLTNFPASRRCSSLPRL